MLRKFILLICMLIFLSCNADALNLSAQSAVLYDCTSQRVIFSKNENEKLPMASTTKIMTGLVALENSSPDEIINVKEADVRVEGSSMYLKAGQHISMKDLLYGLLLMSGNDAAQDNSKSYFRKQSKFRKAYE